MSQPSLPGVRRSPSSSSSSSGRQSRRSAVKQELMQGIKNLLSDTVGEEDPIAGEVLERVNQALSGKAADNEDRPSKDPPASDFARRKVWMKYQFDPKGPRFLAYRGPVSARPPISLVLVHASFSRFALDLENEKLELSEEDFKMAEDVYTMFTEGFNDEVREMNKGKLSRCFESYLAASVFSEMEHNIKMDGLMQHSKKPQPHLIFILFEDKTDDGPNGYLEGLEICRRILMSDDSFSHGILVLRSCPYIIIIAIVMDRKSGVLLSEPLGHIPFWGPEYQTVLRGARAMRALRNFSNSYIPQRDIDVSRPWPIAAWQDVKPLSKDGLVFCGTSDNKRMVAKFTELYSREAHDAWHSNKLAPELYGCKDLGAGWKFVTMHYLSEDEGWQSVAKVPTTKELLTEFLNKGHATNFVHGDFRPPNLLINAKAGEIQAIDFEWSGCVGKAHYPVQLNPKIGWEPTARRGAVLEKIHDLWHVNKISVDPGASTSGVA